jgi:hypothetical protein
MAFLIGFIAFFLVIALTLILGAISRVGDRRVAEEGRVSPDQRPSTDREDRDFHPYNPAHQRYHYA